MDKLHAHIHMGAVKELLYEIDTAVGYIDKKAAIQTLEANAQVYLRQSIAIIDSLLETVEQLTAQNTAMKESLENAKSTIAYLISEYPNEMWTDQSKHIWEEVGKDAIKHLLSTIEGGKADASS